MRAVLSLNERASFSVRPGWIKQIHYEGILIYREAPVGRWRGHPVTHRVSRRREIHDHSRRAGDVRDAKGGRRAEGRGAGRRWIGVGQVAERGARSLDKVATVKIPLATTLAKE